MTASTQINNTLAVPAEEADQAPTGACWSYVPPVSGIVNSAAAVAIKAAATVTRQGSAVGLRHYITSMQISTNTLGADTELVVLDGVTAIWRTILRAGAGGNVPYSICFPPGALRGSANAALNIQTLTAVTGGVFVNAQGYTGA